MHFKQFDGIGQRPEKTQNRRWPGLVLIVWAGVLSPMGCAYAQINTHCPETDAIPVIATPTVKVITLNTGHGRKRSFNQMLLTRNRIVQNLDDIAALLQQSGTDIVALQESDAVSRWSGKLDHVSYLLEKTDYTCFVHGLHAKKWLYTFGTALLSHAQMFEPQSLAFEPSPPTTTKGFVRSTFQWQANGNPVELHVVSVHLDFSRKKVRESQIIEMTQALSALDPPLVVMGDLNGGWSEEQSPVKALVEALKLKVYEPDSAELGSYKSSEGKRLDWILISTDLEFVAHELLSDVVSDHSAVSAEIRYVGVENQ